MALPTHYPFNVKYLNVTSTSSNSQVSTAVPARAKLLTAWVATTTAASQTAAGTVAVTQNGTTVITAASITTSTGNGSTNLGTPSVSTYLAQGDVLATVASSVVGYSATFVVQEF